MFNLYSHQLSILKALIKSSIGEHGSFTETFKDLSNDGEKLITGSDLIYDQIKEIYGETVKYEDYTEHLKRISIDTYFSLLYQYASSDIFEALVTSYLNSYTLSLITGKPIKGNKAYSNIIQNTLLYLEKSTMHDEEIFFDNFSLFYDRMVTEIYNHDNIDDDILDFCDDFKTWNHYRLISIVCLRVLLKACRVGNDDEIDYGGRGGVLKSIVKQLEELTGYIDSIIKRPESSIMGVTSLVTSEAIPRLEFIEAGDFHEAEVVIFDDSTPVSEEDIDVLKEAHSNYTNVDRDVYIIVNGHIVVPCLTDEIYNECTSITLREVD